jgi:hypothetical protein
MPRRARPKVSKFDPAAAPKRTSMLARGPPSFANAAGYEEARPGRRMVVLLRL